MPRRALIDHRPWLLFSIAASVGYFVLSDGDLPGLFLMLVKGLGVGLLAVYAAFRGRGTDGAMITAVLGVSAIADMVLEFSFLFGAALFGLAHLIAIALYLRNRRAAPRRSQVGAGAALVLLVPMAAALLTYPLANWQWATAYAVLLGAMAGAAWTSRFSRYRVGIGAVLFALSDLLIFAREGQRLDPDVAAWLVWPTYYAGQILIAVGVVQASRGMHAAHPASAPKT